MGNREDPEKNPRPAQDESKMLGLVLNMLTLRKWQLIQIGNKIIKLMADRSPPS